jgi:hypothetical protein
MQDEKVWTDKATDDLHRLTGITFFLTAVILVRELPCEVINESFKCHNDSCPSVSIAEMPHGVNCAAITRYSQVSFYLTLLANHWLFALRMLATWRGHSKYCLVLIYSILGMIILTTVSILVSAPHRSLEGSAGSSMRAHDIIAKNIQGGKIGKVMEPYGCIYYLDSPSLPQVSKTVALAVIGAFPHTFEVRVDDSLHLPLLVQVFCIILPT